MSLFGPVVRVNMLPYSHPQQHKLTQCSVSLVCNDKITRSIRVRGIHFCKCNALCWMESGYVLLGIWESRLRSRLTRPRTLNWSLSSTFSTTCRGYQTRTGKNTRQRWLLRARTISPPLVPTPETEQVEFRLNNQIGDWPKMLIAVFVSLYPQDTTGSADIRLARLEISLRHGCGDFCPSSEPHVNLLSAVQDRLLLTTDHSSLRW